MADAPAGARPVSQAEAGLAALAITGDDRAFEELVRRRQGQVRDLMRRLCGDRALADDLAQQAFLRAWRTIRQLRAPGAFGPWLRRVAVNVWLQEARRAHPAFQEFDEAQAEESAGADASDPGDRLDLDRALARLRPPERLCVVLAYAEGLSHAEIAEAAGLPLGTVKSHVQRGAARLRGWLGPEGDVR